MTLMGDASSAESIIKCDAITDFYTSIPRVWDETRFLDSEMGEYAVIARCFQQQGTGMPCC